MTQKKQLQLTLVVCASLTLCAFYLLFGLENSAGHRKVKKLFAVALTKSVPLQDNAHSGSAKTDAVVYILGGRQDSLEFRYKTAAELYQSGLAKTILALSRPGITDYDPLRRRNLSNDEWTIKKLTELGIKREDIELVPMETGMFGTLTEAKEISQIARKKQYRRLLLVTSTYHTERTWLAFSKLKKNYDMTLSIHGSPDPISLPGLFLEYFKLILYKYIIL